MGDILENGHFDGYHEMGYLALFSMFPEPLNVTFTINGYSLEKTIIFKLRPYMHDNTGTRPISEVKHALASSVLWWGTTREYGVL
jgi:hypothetical protein